MVRASADPAVRSWTRTLNLHDAHTLLALAEPGIRRLAWTDACHSSLPHLSTARRRELIRMVRDDFLEWDGTAVEPGVFQKAYDSATAGEQVELVAVRWAQSHPLPEHAVARLVEPALERGDPELPLSTVTAWIDRVVDTDSRASLTKTRAVLLAALEGTGALGTRGTGQHRSVWAKRGEPSARTVGYLTAWSGSTDLVCRLTACTAHHAETQRRIAESHGYL